MPVSDNQLPQSEADRLFSEPKVRFSRRVYDFPPPSGKLTLRLVSIVSGEVMLLDITMGRKRRDQFSVQLRARGSVALARLDIGGRPHRNPDRTTVPCPHLHLYREADGDRWAIPAYVDIFPNMHDPRWTLYDFVQYCNVIEPPYFR